MDHNAGIKLDHIKDVPLPVDIHVARASSRMLFHGALDGRIESQRGIDARTRLKIQDGWRSALKGSVFYPLELDEPLWILGEYKKLNEFLESVRNS